MFLTSQVTTNKRRVIQASLCIFDIRFVCIRFSFFVYSSSYIPSLGTHHPVVVVVVVVVSDMTNRMSVFVSVS